MKMVAEIPLDLLEILKHIVSGNIEEYEIKIVPNEKGQGFAAEIVFLTLIHKQTEEKYELIAKQELKASHKNEEVFSLIVHNELNFYQIVWPVLQGYYKKISGKELNIVPKYFGTSSTGRKRIIMENLMEQGFKLYNKMKALDHEHFKKLFTSYGIYHGISMALREKEREEYNRCVASLNNIYKHLVEGDSNFRQNMNDRFQEAQKYFDPEAEKYILEKLRIYEETGINMIYHCLNDEFPKGVIIHGDCWSNNLMFRYDEQRNLQEIKMLDFQAVCHSTPILDLSYCMYSGASEESLNRLDDYLIIYHDSLSSTLSEFGLLAQAVYSFQTLKEEWKKYCKCVLPLSLLAWKVKLAINVPDFSQDMNDTIKLSDATEECYKEKVRELVFHMYKNNFL